GVHALQVHRPDIVIAYRGFQSCRQRGARHVLIRIRFVSLQITFMMMNVIKNAAHGVAIGGRNGMAPVSCHDLTPCPLTCLHSQSTIVGSVCGVKPMCPPGNKRTVLGEPLPISSDMSSTGHCRSSLPFTSSKGAHGCSSTPWSNRDKRLKPPRYSLSSVAPSIKERVSTSSIR